MRHCWSTALMPKLSDISNKMGLWCFFGSVWLVCYMVGFCSVVDFLMEGMDLLSCYFLFCGWLLLSTRWLFDVDWVPLVVGEGVLVGLKYVVGGG